MELSDNFGECTPQIIDRENEPICWGKLLEQLEEEREPLIF